MGGRVFRGRRRTSVRVRRGRKVFGHEPGTERARLEPSMGATGRGTWAGARSRRSVLPAAQEPLIVFETGRPVSAHTPRAQVVSRTPCQSGAIASAGSASFFNATTPGSLRHSRHRRRPRVPVQALSGSERIERDPMVANEDRNNHNRPIDSCGSFSGNGRNIETSLD